MNLSCQINTFNTVLNQNRSKPSDQISMLTCSWFVSSLLTCKNVKLIVSPMWYSPIQSVASTSSLMSQEMTRFWPRFSVYSSVDAVSEDRLWEVTRSVSLLARGRPMGLLTTETVSTEAPPLSARVRRFSGLRVCRRWGLRLRGADRCSRPPTARLGGLWERVLGGRTAVAREGRMLHDSLRRRLAAEELELPVDRTSRHGDDASQLDLNPHV